MPIFNNFNLCNLRKKSEYALLHARIIVITLQEGHFLINQYDQIKLSHNSKIKNVAETQFSKLRLSVTHMWCWDPIVWTLLIWISLYNLLVKSNQSMSLLFLWLSLSSSWLPFIKHFLCARQCCVRYFT